MITTIAFDADQTLVDTRIAISAALNLVAAELGDPRLTETEFRIDSSQMWAEAPELAVVDLRTESFRRTLSRFDRVDDLDRVLKRFFEVRFAQTKPFPGTIEVLAELRKTYQLGYATNGNSVADRCGLAGEFAFEIYALRNGIPKKPDPAFYTAITAAAKADADQIVYVGDSYDHDVAGPTAAGLKAVWLNPAGATQPSAVIRTLAELPDALAHLT